MVRSKKKNGGTVPYRVGTVHRVEEQNKKENVGTVPYRVGGTVHRGPLPLVQKTFSQAVVEAFIQAAKSTACTRGQY